MSASRMAVLRRAPPGPLADERSAVAFVASCIFMTSLTYAFGRYAYGLFLPAIRAEYALSNFSLGLLASINTCAYLLATLITSAKAIYFRPHVLIFASGVITVLGLTLLAVTSHLAFAAAGIIIAGVGAGVYTPPVFEAVEAGLPTVWKNRAIAALNAGATPGLVLTGLAAYWIHSSWRLTYLAMAGLGVIITLWNASVMPRIEARTNGTREVAKLRLGEFLRPALIPLYITVFVYGLLFSIYKTFAVDLLSSSGGLRYPTDQLFWAVLGLAGIPAVLAGEFITRFGVRAILLTSMPLCSVSYLLLAIAPNQKSVIFLSAIIFGLASIIPGSGFLVWGIRLFRDRPSLGSGLVFLVFSAALIVGPVSFGALERWVSQSAFFLVIAALGVVVSPLFPRQIFTIESDSDRRSPDR